MPGAQPPSPAATAPVLSSSPQIPAWALERARRLRDRVQQKAAVETPTPFLFGQAPATATVSASAAALYGGRRLFVLLSSSLPASLARTLAREAKEKDAVLALRGLVKDSFPATLSWNAGLGEDIRLWIDPFLFERFAVEAAPTFVWSSRALQPCSPRSCETPPYLKISGAVSLEYALAALIRGRPRQEPWLHHPPGR